MSAQERDSSDEIQQLRNELRRSGHPGSDSTNTLVSFFS